MKNKVTIKAVGEKCTPIIHFFLTEPEAKAFILGWQEAIHIPGSPEYKITMDGRDINDKE